MFGSLVNLAINTANAWLQQNHPTIDVALKPRRTRYANDDMDQLEDDADDLVADQTDIILAAGGPQSAIVARDATADAQPNVAQRIPVVFTTVVNPVQLGLRNSCNVPGGTNMTGMAGQTSENDPRRLRILRQLLVAQGRVGTVYGVLVNPSRQKNREQFLELKHEAEQNLGIILVRRRANNLRGIKRAYEFFRGENVAGVVVTADAFFNNNRQKIVEEAAPDPTTNRLGVPTIYQWREFTDNFTVDGVQKNGGLISFGPSMSEAYEKAGEYVGRVAAGASPSDIACSVPDEDLIQVWVNDRTAVAHQMNLANIPALLDGKQVYRRP